MVLRLATYTCLFLLITACKKENALDCFKTTGAEKTETRYPGEFNSLEAFDKVDVTVVPGNEYKVTVHAGEHLLKNITTHIKDNKLSIKNNNTCNFVRGYKRKITVTVTMPVARNIVNSGVGDLRVNGFSQDSMDVSAESSGDIYVTGNFHQLSTYSNGNGDIYLNGTCTGLHAYLYGTNFLHAEDLIVTDYVSVETVSVGDCFLNASSGLTLNIEIWRSGNIYYKGTPATIISTYQENCKGRLILQN